MKIYFNKTTHKTDN